MPKVLQLYYITHIDNIASMLKHGVLSHQEVLTRDLTYVPIYNKSIVNSRRAKKTPDGKSLWEYANVYFKPRNAMLYQVVAAKQKPIEEIAIIVVDYHWIVSQPGVFISTGNAANNDSEFVPTIPRKRIGEAFAKFGGALALDYGREDNGTKRMMMAECLVPEKIPPDRITAIYTPGRPTADRIMDILRHVGRLGLPVIPQPDMFFQPSFQRRLTSNLTLKAGDMFFSRLHTLTVSVNTVSIMGKGVASRAKYQFPDVYVEYQDAVRRKSLRMGKPYLYKREKSVDYELADDPTSLEEPNAQTWFLLFATKNHYSEQASTDGIEKGLKWIQEHYKDEGIKSLAVPALGAGLGRLNWKDIGPVICRHLAGLDIPVEVYLPAEKDIPDDQLTREFLLPERPQRDATLS